MSLKRNVVRKLEHNAWANERFVEWLSAKDEALLSREAASSCPTILATFKHIWEAQEYWTGVVGETEEFTRVWEMEELSKSTIFDGLISNSKRLAQIAASLSDEELIKEFPVKNQWLDCALPKAEYLEQVAGHGLYHRGQIVTMARGFGVTDPPMTDFIMWAMK